MKKNDLCTIMIRPVVRALATLKVTRNIVMFENVLNSMVWCGLVWCYIISVLIFKISVLICFYLALSCPVPCHVV
jgi:hypothetical protein